MKYLVRILFLIVLGFIAFGYFHKNNGNTEGDKWVGIGVLILAFIFQTLFKFSKRDWILTVSAFIIGVVTPMILQSEIWQK